jgi:hypothetical protein
MNFRTKNNRFLKNLITTQFNITRYARTNTFYSLDLPALQRELKLLIRLLHHAKKKAAQMFLKPGNNSGSEEILTELVANLNLQIKILSKKNTTNPQTDKSLTKIKKPFLKRRREPAKIVFYLRKAVLKLLRKFKKLILIILLLVLRDTLIS